MTPNHGSLRSAVLTAVLLAVAACGDNPTQNGPPPLRKVIGDIEGPIGSFCAAPGPVTAVGANSISVPANGLAAAAADTTFSLADTTGAVTTLSFAFDVGGGGFSVVLCNLGGTALEGDGVTQNGPVLHKPWHIAGLTPGATYDMTFTGGGVGSVRRSIRMLVDADGDGALEAGEQRDLIGLDGVVETRAFPGIVASAGGTIRGEYWGGSTNGAGENGAWRGWTIIGTP